MQISGEIFNEKGPSLLVLTKEALGLGVVKIVRESWEYPEYGQPFDVTEGRGFVWPGADHVDVWKGRGAVPVLAAVVQDEVPPVVGAVLVQAQFYSGVVPLGLLEGLNDTEITECMVGAAIGPNSFSRTLAGLIDTFNGLQVASSRIQL